MNSEWASYQQSPLAARQRIRQRIALQDAALAHGSAQVRAHRGLLHTQHAADTTDVESDRPANEPGNANSEDSAVVPGTRSVYFFWAFVDFFLSLVGSFERLAMRPAERDPDSDSSLIILEHAPEPWEATKSETNKLLQTTDRLLEPDHQEKDGDEDDQLAHQLWIDTTVVPEHTSQYGTSFGNAKLSKFLRERLLDRDHNRINSHSNRGATQSGALFPSEPRKTAYDDAVARFYLPRAPLRAQHSLVDTLVDTYLANEVARLKTDREKRDTKRHLISSEREALESRITPLTSDQLAVVAKHWKSPGSGVVRSQFQIDITDRDLSTLSDGQWLNDNVIDFYFNLFTNERVFGWTTHFYTTLKERGYAGVARWAKRKKVNVTTRDIVLVPINIMGTHWALAAVDNRQKRFLYYDSLSSRGNPQALQLLRQYMTAEAEKQNSSVDYSTFEMLPSEPAPQQLNGYDCGVFTCTCARFVAMGQRLSYGQRDMKVLRRRMAYEIVQGKLLE